MLRPDLDQIIERAADRGLQTYIASNATLVTAERARAIINPYYHPAEKSAAESTNPVTQPSADESHEQLDS